MKKRIPNKTGQSLIEYVAITALVAIVCITAVRAFGSKINRRLTQISNAFDHQVQIGLKYKGHDIAGESYPNDFPSTSPVKRSGSKFPILDGIFN